MAQDKIFLAGKLEEYREAFRQAAALSRRWQTLQPPASLHVLCTVLC